MSLYPLHAINLNMLQVQGRSDVFLFIEILKKIVSVIPICMGIFIGIYWMLISSIFAGIINYFINSYYTGKLLGYTSWMQIKDIYVYYIRALIITLPVYFLKLFSMEYGVVLMLQIIVLIILFFMVNYLIKSKELISTFQIVKSLIKK